MFCGLKINTIIENEMSTIYVFGIDDVNEILLSFICVKTFYVSLILRVVFIF